MVVVGAGTGVVTFRAFFDDAALFPPGDAPMAAAVPAHRALRDRFGALVGPFVVPAGRLDELAAHLDEPLAISVIATAQTLPAALAHPGAGFPAAVEVSGVVDAATARQAVRVLPEGLPAAVELPRTAARDAVLDVLAAAGHRAKLRTGGVRAELFPGPAELAATLAACVARRTPFKCTAGLHHAVRHTDPRTGFTHHGFLNVLVATDALRGGDRGDGGDPGGAADPAAAENWLAETDGARLAAAVRRWSPERTAAARALFTSFGTCSVTEPIHDLTTLGLLEGNR